MYGPGRRLGEHKMKKLSAIFSILFFGFLLNSYSQSITCDLTTGGPYGTGSSIAVAIKLDENSGFFKIGNQFRLYLSDASGNFAAEKEIGTYDGFYSTFINGVIPDDLPPGHYKLRVKSTAPAITSPASAGFELKTGPGIVAEITAQPQQIIGSGANRAFGYCSPGKNNQRFNFSNGSSPGATVTAKFRNEGTGAESMIDCTGSEQSFLAQITHYTILVRAELNGVVGTKAYFLINNQINTPFNPPGNSTVCLPLGALQYNVETTSTNGIQLNFPGNTYQVTWGDGVTESFVLSQIRAADGKISHVYTKSSCGSQITIGSIKYYNVFGIVVQSKSPFCGNIGVPISSQAKVITQPENRFTLPSLTCIDSPLTISNSSLAGEDPSATSPQCQNNNVLYYWYVDNKLVTPQGVPLSWQLNYTFSSPGFHTVRLESESTSDCQAAPIEKKIYVQQIPVPDFSLSTSTYCLGTNVKPINTSVLDTGTLAKATYKWTASGPAPVTFLKNTNSGSPNPEFGFTKAGIYKLSLSITSACKTVSSSELSIFVNSTPGITTNWLSSLCGKNQQLTFNNTAGNPVQTAFEGTYNDIPSSYFWSISGGRYSFEKGTNASSKEPSVLFQDYGTYTIEVVHLNNCGRQSITKTITFNESPTVNAGDDFIICARQTVQLNGSMPGAPVSSFAWKGGSGSFAPGRNVLNPVYTPSAEEIASGEVTLILSAVTNNPPPCDNVEDALSIHINPVNQIEGLSDTLICHNSILTRIFNSTVSGTHFRWTAEGSENAKGYTSFGEGNLSETLSNSSIVDEATVTYTVVPVYNNCEGDASTFTVRILPPLTVEALLPAEIICSGKPASIILRPNVKGLKFKWTSFAEEQVTGNSTMSSPTADTVINDLLFNAGTVPAKVLYRVTPVTEAGCEGKETLVSVTVSRPPARASAGPDALLYDQTSYTLVANDAQESVGRWTLESGQPNVTFERVDQAHTSVNGLVPGQTYRFAWTISGPYNCGVSRDETVVRILPLISPNKISSPVNTTCQGNSIDVKGSLPTGGDGSFSYSWEASTNGTDWDTLAGESDMNLHIIADTSIWIRRKVTSAGFYSYSNEVSIEVQRAISNNTIEASQFICSGIQPQELSGTLPAGGNGLYSYQWEIKDEAGNWVAIAGANQQCYQPGKLSRTSIYRRLVTTALCAGPQKSISNEVTIKVSAGPIAKFQFTTDIGCAPFRLSAGVITTSDSEPGDLYIWYMNGTVIGKGKAFPGFTLVNAGDSSVIKLEVSSVLGCGAAYYSHTFRTSPPVQADFKADKNGGCGPLSVSLTNTTANADGVKFVWDFGNGKTSTLVTPPIAIFNSRPDGRDTIYKITLTATSTCAISKRTFEVKVTGTPLPSFVPDKTLGCSPLTVTFKNNTQGASNKFIWDFGDGSPLITSTSKDPVSHTYVTNSGKNFPAKLTVVNECGTAEKTFVIKTSPNTVYPDLVVNGGDYEGCAPHTVIFTNASTGAGFYTYDFGDGSAPYTTNNAGPVTHTFLKAGTYKVVLKAGNGCSDTTTNETIKVWPQAETSFSADVTKGCNVLSVKFSNHTQGGTAYIWDFGDGETSTAPSPTHVYKHRNTPYTVRLISTSRFGCPDTLEKKNLIRVIPPPVARFDVLPGELIKHPNYTFDFKDISDGDIVSSIWDFGDKSPLASGSNMTHTYADTGTYFVRMKVVSREGCADSAVKKVRISGIPGNLSVPNAFMPNSVTEELRSFRAKGSGIAKWHMRVFNKWGEQLWQTDRLDKKGSPLDSWDGTWKGQPVQQGIYFWEITATFKNGTEWAGMTYNSSEPKRTGSIHLIR